MFDAEGLEDIGEYGWDKLSLLVGNDTDGKSKTADDFIKEYLSDSFSFDVTKSEELAAFEEIVDDDKDPCITTACFRQMAREIDSDSMTGSMDDNR